MRLHIFGLPHSQIRKDLPWAFCAYSMKIYNMCKMFYDEGHEVYLYANGQSTAPCTKLIDYFPEGMFERVHGPITDTSRPSFGVDVETYQYAKDHFAEEVNKNLKGDESDIVLSTFGDGFGGETFDGCIPPVIESAVGYPYAHHAHFKVFESHYMRNFIRGRHNNQDPNYSEKIIHGYIDPNDYIFSDTHDDYFLYLARVEDDYASQKGLHFAVELQEKYKFKLKIAGPGPGEKYVKPGVEYVGPVWGKEKAKLISKAKALFSMSLYPEPFGYIVIESLISGTPVITTDHGAFPETVIPGVGFRGIFFQDFKYAIENIDKIDRKFCRDYAMEHFSLKKQYIKYVDFFEKVIKAHHHGWYVEGAKSYEQDKILKITSPIRKQTIPTINKPSKKLKIHMIAAPHMNVKLNKEMATCAYSTKIYLFCKKLVEEGHEVVHYGIEGNECPATEQVPYVSLEAWEESHGSRSAEKFHDFGDHLRSYQEGSKNLLPEVNKRFKNNGNEVILSTFGPWCPQLSQLPGAVVEWGIGYDWAWSKYKVFESYAWQHIQYSKLGPNYDIEGPKWTDAVIPGYVDKDQFRFNPKNDGYMLFLGRIMDTKGIHVALQLAKDYKIPLLVAGNGQTKLIKDEQKQFPDLIKYVGVADMDAKRELFANAKVTLCMTEYVEPFGNVHIESLMSGTPVIATDYGVYTETVPNGIVGYRGRTYEDHCYALENIHKINPQTCRNWAEANFSLEAVYPKFIDYFTKCAKLETIGPDEGHHYYSTIRKDHPGYCNRFTDYWTNYLLLLKQKKGEV